MKSVPFLRRGFTSSLRDALPFASIMAVAVLLRVLYLIITPFSVREHDVNAHIQYIEYVSDHWVIPVAGTGWEFHQAPLYYFLNAPLFLWFRFGLELQRDEQLFGLQLLSVLMSIGIVLVSFDIARTALRGRRTASALFCLFIATFPGLIILSQGLNNDSLSSLMTFALFAAIVRYWESGTARAWYAVVALFLLSVLTKTSGFLFVPVIAFVFVAKERWDLRDMAKKALWSSIAFIPLYAWLPAIRFAHGTDELLPSAQDLSADVLLPSTWVNFLTFNPVAMLAVPFVDAHDDHTRRAYFWEYLYRSSFFGEWTFASETYVLAVAILATGLVVLALSLAYTVTSIRKMFWDHVPVWLTTACLLTAIVFYRLHNPCSCNQDYRFIPVVAATLALAALSWNPRTTLGRAIVYVPIAVLCVLQTAFIVYIYGLATQ